MTLAMIYNNSIIAVSRNLGKMYQQNSLLDAILLKKRLVQLNANNIKNIFLGQIELKPSWQSRKSYGAKFGYYGVTLTLEVDT